MRGIRRIQSQLVEHCQTAGHAFDADDPATLSRVSEWGSQNSSSHGRWVVIRARITNIRALSLKSTPPRCKLCWGWRERPIRFLFGQLMIPVVWKVKCLIKLNFFKFFKPPLRLPLTRETRDGHRSQTRYLVGSAVPSLLEIPIRKKLMGPTRPTEYAK